MKDKFGLEIFSKAEVINQVKELEGRNARKVARSIRYLMEPLALFVLIVCPEKFIAEAKAVVK